MNSPISIQLGARIRTLRQAAGLSQAQLASLILKSVETISNFERGRTLPSVQTLAALARELHCQIGELFTDVELERRARDQHLLRIEQRMALLSETDRALLADFAQLLVDRR